MRAPSDGMIEAGASFRTAENSGKGRKELRWMGGLLRTIREAAPRKTRLAFNQWTGLSLRQCDYILAEKSGMSLETFRALLETPCGYEILASLWPENERPAWLEELGYVRESMRLQDDIKAARERQNALKKRKRI